MYQQSYELSKEVNALSKLHLAKSKRFCERLWEFVTSKGCVVIHLQIRAKQWQTLRQDERATMFARETSLRVYAY